MHSHDEAQTEKMGEFGSHETTDPKARDVSLYAPQHINLYEVSLRRSPRLKKKAKQIAKQKKAHVTFVKRLPKLVSLFTLLCTVSNKKSMPDHQTSPNASFTEQAMSRLRKLNESYDGTLNNMHTFAFSTLDVIYIQLKFLKVD